MFRKLFRFLFFLIVTIAAVFIIDDYLYYNFDYSLFYGDMSYLYEEMSEMDEDGMDGDDICNVYGVELRGDITTYISADNIAADGSQLYDEIASEYILALIDEAEADEEIKAIIVEIDSYGGNPVAAEEIASALKRAKKPTVAFVRTGALSAAYWAASGADIIFASEISDIGSIGVTFSYLDKVKQNEREGLTYNNLSTGLYKDYGDPNKPLTPQERDLIMRDLNIIHEHFIKSVAENRGLAVDKVRGLADGSSMPGVLALKEGLIDRIGGYYDFQDYLSELLGEKAQVCW